MTIIMVFIVKMVNICFVVILVIMVLRVKMVNICFIVIFWLLWPFHNGFASRKIVKTQVNFFNF